jgi:hypothetical protein
LLSKLFPNRNSTFEIQKSLYLFLKKSCHKTDSVQENLLNTMKKISTLSLSIALGVTLTLFTSCKKSETTAEQPPPSASKTPAGNIQSAEKNSFQEVTSHLDPGGNLYLYFSTEQLLDGLSGKTSNLRQLLSAIPNVKEEDRQNLEKALNIITNLVKTSGVEDVSGFGASSIAREKEFYYTKSMLHHYKGKGSGFLWSLFGQKPHPLDGLNLLSTNTAVAMFCDFDLPLLWSVIEKQVAQSGFAEAEQELQKLPQQFEAATGLKWDQVLASLGGEYGLVLTLNESKKISIPIPGGQQPLEIPEPALMLVANVKDNTIFNRVDEALKSSKQSVFRTDEADLKMRTIALPLPLPIQLGPTIATSQGYLFIGSTDLIVKEALAVNAGKSPGLKSTQEFQRLAKDVPQQGNNFVFLSERFGNAVREIQTQALTMTHASDNQKDLLSMFRSEHAPYLFSVGANTDEGWLGISNGNQHPSKLFLVSAIVPVSVSAAMLLPALAKAKQRAQTINCINNLRQIDIAKQAWAAEKSKGPTDAPTISDLLPHLGGKFPICPAGGTYTINAVSTAPECSIPKHVLPK